jgi:hypothetical protein
MQEPGFEARSEIVEQDGKGLLIAAFRNSSCEGNESLFFLSIHFRSQAPYLREFPAGFQRLNDLQRILERSNSCLNLYVLDSSAQMAFVAIQAGHHSKRTFHPER